MAVDGEALPAAKCRRIVASNAAKLATRRRLFDSSDRDDARRRRCDDVFTMQHASAINSSPGSLVNSFVRSLAVRCNTLLGGCCSCWSPVKNPPTS